MTTEIPDGNDSLEDRILGGLDAEQREVASTLTGNTLDGLLEREEVHGPTLVGRAD